MHNKTILIVDDDENVRTLLGETFRAQSYQVVIVENGQTALEQLQRTRFDLVITEYDMPRMDGLELLRKIKRERPWLPVLVFTGDGPEQEFLKSGATACIRKPLELKKLQQLAGLILLDSATLY